LVNLFINAIISTYTYKKRGGSLVIYFNMYDLIIIGGSAAATSAGIYAARRNLNFKIICKSFGGEVATSGEVANWPGIIKIDGYDLAQQFKEHLKSYGVVPQEDVRVEKITIQPDGTFAISAKNSKGETISVLGRSVIFATGVHPKEIQIPGEKEYRNKGVTYCTVCDGPLFSGKTVAVIGGGNSALESALMLADICPKVYILNKNQQFKGEQVLIDKVNSKTNVEIWYSAKIFEIFGGEFVTGFKFRDNIEQERQLDVEGIFVHIGMTPNSDVAPGGVEKNEFGEIKVGKMCETNIPGFFAAGDVTDVPFKQIVIAAGQGTVAALSVVGYLNKLK
jgi:NADH-dependent peroxiredoxin subunit F